MIRAYAKPLLLPTTREKSRDASCGALLNECEKVVSKHSVTFFGENFPGLGDGEPGTNDFAVLKFASEETGGTWRPGFYRLDSDSENSMKCSGNCRGRLDYSFDLSFPIDSTNHQLSPFLASAQPVAPFVFSHLPQKSRAESGSSFFWLGQGSGARRKASERVTNRRQNYYIVSVPFLTDIRYSHRCNDIVVLA